VSASYTVKQQHSMDTRNACKSALQHDWLVQQGLRSEHTMSIASCSLVYKASLPQPALQQLPCMPLASTARASAHHTHPPPLRRSITTYRGNYDVFVKTAEERLRNATKAAEAQAAKRAHVQVRAGRQDGSVCASCSPAVQLAAACWP
jgi:hypothetical protein